MRERTCEGCGSTAPMGQLFDVRGKVLCEKCGDAALEKQPAQPGEVRRLSDPTVCAYCQKDFGDTELELVGGAGACPTCAGNLRHRPFPTWLEVSFAALLALLVVSLVRGVPYFRAEVDFLRAKRHMAAGQYAEATPELARVLAAAPACRDAMLLQMKAAVLTDDFQTAFEGARRANGVKFEDGLIDEVNGLMDRADAALQDFQKAMDLYKEGKEAEAYVAVTAAHEKFPESRGLHFNYLLGKANSAFDHEDWDQMLAASEEALKLKPDDHTAVMGLAGALSCKYAVTGDSTFETRARASFARAKTLCTEDGCRADLAEYEPRFEHRLRSREIITKVEYDRRFRGEQK